MRVRPQRVDALRCRATVSTACFAGQHFPEWDDDGTYDRASDSVVCDSCYIEVMNASPSGRALAHEIEPTIKRIKAARGTA